MAYRETNRRPRPYSPLEYPQPPYYSKAPPKNEQDCRELTKYAIFGFNILFILVGFLTLAMGTWLRTDSRFREFLSERYRNAVDGEFWNAPTLYTFSYLLIVLGATMIVVAMIGCCGVAQGSRLFLGFYAFALFVLLIFTVSCGVFILYRQNGIDVELSDALNYMVQHYYQGPGIIQEALDRLQQAFRCCGNAGCSDFTAFRQDWPRTCDIRCDGCHYRIMLALRIGFSIAIVIFGICILAEIIGIAIALVLAFRERPRKYAPPVYLYPSREAYERSVLDKRRTPTVRSKGYDRSYVSPRSKY